MEEIEAEQGCQLWMLGPVVTDIGNPNVLKHSHCPCVRGPGLRSVLMHNATGCAASCTMSVQ